MQQTGAVLRVVHMLRHQIDPACQQMSFRQHVVALQFGILEQLPQFAQRTRAGTHPRDRQEIRRRLIGTDDDQPERPVVLVYHVPGHSQSVQAASFVLRQDVEPQALPPQVVEVRQHEVAPGPQHTDTFAQRIAPVGHIAESALIREYPPDGLGHIEIRMHRDLTTLVGDRNQVADRAPRLFGAFRRHQLRRRLDRHQWRQVHATECLQPIQQLGFLVQRSDQAQSFQ